MILCLFRGPGALAADVSGTRGLRQGGCSKTAFNPKNLAGALAPFRPGVLAQEPSYNPLTRNALKRKKFLEVDCCLESRP